MAAKKPTPARSRTSVRTDATNPADALIAAAGKAQHSPDPSPEAVEALRKVLAYNDTRPHYGASGRVPRAAAAKMMREHFGWCHGENALESFCVRVLGRKSWGSP